MSARKRDELLREYERWGFDERGWAPRTREKYVQRAKVADDWLLLNRSTSLLWASQKDLQAYLFSTTPNACNRNNIRQALVGFGAFCIARGLVQSNQALGLPRLTEPDSIPKAHERGVAERIDAIAQTLRLVDQVLVLTYLYTGLRKSEARLLEWSMFDEAFEWVRFAGKRGRIREVWIADELRSPLRRWRAESSEAQWVFPSPRNNGRAISDSYVKQVLYEVGDMCGIDHLHPHALRHTLATTMLEEGADITDVQATLGHAAISTTSIYLLIRPARVKASMGRVHFRALAD